MKIFSKLSLITFAAFGFLAKAQAKSTTEYLNTAQHLVSTGNLNEALSVYSEALSHDPNNFLIYVRRAILYINIGRTESAIDDFTSLIKINPNFEQAYLKRGKLYFQIAELDKAKDDIEHYKKLKPSDGETDEIVCIKYDNIYEKLNKFILLLLLILWLF